jgi:hypothetical protein
MSRYLILLLLNTPFILAGLTNSFINYKLSKISRRRYIYQSSVWTIIFLGLALAQPIYEFLFSNDLTQTEPLSLFDVIQITGIIAVIFVLHRTREKLEALEQHIQNLHQELSIRLSSDTPQKKKIKQQ